MFPLFCSIFSHIFSHFDAKLSFALLNPFSNVKVEPKRSEAKIENKDKTAKRSFASRISVLAFDAKLRFKTKFSFSCFFKSFIEL